MSDELPLVWATAPLSELLVALESGSRPRGGVRGISEGVPSLGGEHLKYDGGFDFSSVKYVPESFASAMTKGKVQTNDILIVKDGATTGKTAFVDSTFPFQNAVVNEHVFICRPAQEVEPRFLFRFLMSKDGQERILENFKGSAQGGINQSFAPNTGVPLAPLAEQRRIVAKLEQVLGKVESCQRRLAKIPALLKRFRQSVLAAACSGRLTADWRETHSANSAPPREKIAEGSRRDAENAEELPDTWAFVEFRVLIADGPQNGLYKPASFYGSGTPIVRIDAFYDGAIAAWNELKRLRLTQKERKQYELRNGDILVNRVNSPKFLGKVALVRGLSEPCVYESNMMRLRLKTEWAFPEYAMLYLRSMPGLSELRKNAKHAVNQSSINQEDVQSVVFNLPPLPEQQEIVRRVEALFALADKIEARYAKAQAQVDRLTPALLARAFAGKLVPQNPADEPAAVLLERIRRKGPAASAAPTKIISYSEAEPRELKVAEPASGSRTRRRR